MFPSSNNDNPYSYPNDTLFRKSFTYNENPNSRQEEPPFFLHFPSPFLDDHEFLFTHTFPQQQQLAESEANMEVTNKAININSEISSNTATEQTLPEVGVKKRSKGEKQQRRSGKKDRHSKIYTAQGLRDRRMRLSLQIARKFFDLQDMLGLDKASATIEWLFDKSKKAIKELTRNGVRNNNNNNNSSSNNSGGKSESLMSESEAESEKEMESNEEWKGSETLVGEGGERKKRKSRKEGYNPIARESREKARARARERTREKMMMKFKGKAYNLAQLGSCSPFETGEESSSRSQEKNSPHELEASSNSLEHQMANVGMIEQFLGTTSSSTPYSLFDFQKNGAFSGGLDSNNYFLGFLGNWEVENARINCNNCVVPLTTGKVHGQNPNSISMANSNMHFQFQNQEN